MDGLDLLKQLNNTSKPSVGLDMGKIFKFPMAIVVFGNILYAFLVVLKVRILTDTFESTDKKKILAWAYMYLFIVIGGSLLSLLFIILG
jgi:Na+-driven multidrug efflux pump